MWHTARRWVRHLRKPSTPVVGRPRGRAAAEHVSSYLTLRYQGWISVLSTGNWKVSFWFLCCLVVNICDPDPQYMDFADIVQWWYQQSEMLNTNFVLYKFVVDRGVLLCQNNFKSRQKKPSTIYAGRLILCWISIVNLNISHTSSKCDVHVQKVVNNAWQRALLGPKCKYRSLNSVTPPQRGHVAGGFGKQESVGLIW